MQRRQFIHSSCNLCLLGAGSYFLSSISGCAPAKYPVINAEVINKKIFLPLSAFATTNMQIVRPKGWYYDIAVQKKDEQSFSALLLQCTHQENQLSPSANGFHCSLHGSDFDKNGIVKKGPAEHNLEQYKTYTENNQLIIEVKNSLL